VSNTEVVGAVGPVGLVAAARACGVTVAEIRRLEMKGLIPKPRRDGLGRRLYGERDLQAIAQMVKLKNTLRGGVPSTDGQ
jgi:DNA-binding transcriptional MerR regulator